MILRNQNGEEIDKLLVDDGNNTMYEGLPFGMYQLFVDDVEKPVNIRVA